MKTAWTRKLLFSSLALLASCLLASPLMADSDDPPGRVARLSYMSGNVSFQPSGEDQWSQASLNYPLTAGDRLYTDSDARAELETGNIAVRLSASTDLTAANMSDELLQLGLAQGTLRVRVYDMLEGHSVEIDTPNVALTLLRAGSYRVETYPDDNTTLVYVISGDLEVSGNGISQTVHSGEALRLIGTDDVQMDWISPPRDDDFDDWCGQRDRRFLDSRSRHYVSNHTPGYADLDQYGSWAPDAEYGQVWYPTNVAYGWAPYRYGRWVFIQPWGWTWVAEEPWGFTPFHYGRWVFIRSRWAWCPGPVAVRPLYAPALVAFVGGPRAGISVWFPLGPRDPYFPWYHHSDHYLRQVNVTNVSVRNVTVINNYINVRNANVRYQYQRVAPTAVSTDAFRSARRVDREMVRLRPDEIGRARVIPHPEVTPDVRAIHAGAPEAHPPVVRDRPRFEERRDAGENRGGRPAGGNQRDNQPGNRDDRFNRGRQDNRPVTAPTAPAVPTYSGGEHRVPATGTQPPAVGQPPARTNQGDRDWGRGRTPDAGGRPPVTTPPPTTSQPPAPPVVGQPPARTNQGNRDFGRGRGPDAGGRPPVTTPPPATTQPPVAPQPPARTDQGNRDFGRGRGPDAGGRPPVTTPPPATAQPPVPQPPARTDQGNRDFGRGRVPDAGSRPPVTTPPPATAQPPVPQPPARTDQGNRDRGRTEFSTSPAQQPRVTNTPPPAQNRDREVPPHQANPRSISTPPPNQGGNKPDDKQDKKPDDKDKKR